MGFVGLHIQLSNLAILVIVLVSHSSAITPQNLSLAKPNCPDHCGNVKIPFPFGTSLDCYLRHQFLVNCRHSSNGPKAFLANTNIEITDISLDGQLTVLNSIAYDCYGPNQRRYDSWMNVGSFTVNDTVNKFTVVGCDTYAYVYGGRGLDKYHQKGYTSMCRKKGDLDNGSGWCQMSFPNKAGSTTLQVRSFWNYSNVSDFNDCGFAFVAEESAFTFSQESITNLKNVRELPVVLDWDIGNVTDCHVAKMEASTYACRSVDSECSVPDNGNGYRCCCKQGYQGNPYLDAGCQDVDECQNGKNNCEDERCKNTQGSYECICPKWYRGDGRRDGEGCRRVNLLQKLAEIFRIDWEEKF